MTTPKLKMHTVRVADKTFMVYAQSEPSARKKFNDAHVSVARATDLEIASHVRAGLPIIGEPEPVGEKQGGLDV